MFFRLILVQTFYSTDFGQWQPVLDSYNSLQTEEGIILNLKQGSISEEIVCKNCNYFLFLKFSSKTVELFCS